MTSTAARFTRHGVALAACGIGLYVVAPSLLTVFDAWPRLRDVRPWWFPVLVLLELASFASLWLLLRIALPGGRWLEIAAGQLAGNAASRVLPGGAASGAVVQGRLLVRSGHPAGTVSAVLSATGLLTTGALLALPVITLPAVLFGAPLAHELEVGLVVSLVVGAVMVGLGLALLVSDRLVGLLGHAAGRAVHLVRRRVEPARVAARFVTERDLVAAAFQGRWLRALACAAANRMFDYATLVASLLAVGAQARPSLVLVAYVASVAIALVPVTPGGLGLVEAGLTALLVLAGVAADQAIVGTLLYRLASYWLPIPIGAVAWVGWRLHPRQRKASRVAGPTEP
jgi:uncharacterized membrane protein YbhN (UPF0104 family)